MIPLRTSRTFTVRGRPPRLAGRINGATSAHSASVRSLSYRRPRRSAAARCSGFHMRHLRIRCRPRNHKRFPRLKFFPERLSGGFWRVAYRASDYSNPIDDWQTLVQAGDIVRMGWSGGGDHTTTVLSKNPDGSITVFDNADFLGNKEIINIHTVNYEQLTNSHTITIYRLSPDHLYLINGNLGGEYLAGTVYADAIHSAGDSSTLRGGPRTTFCMACWATRLSTTETDGTTLSNS